MRNLCIVTAMAATVGIAGSASAKDKTADSVKPAPATAQQLQRADPSVSLDRRICVRSDATTGTRLRREECHSYGEWLASGTDPLAEQAK